MEKKEIGRIIDCICDAMNLSVNEIRNMMKQNDSQLGKSSGQIPIQAYMSRNKELEKVIRKTIGGLNETRKSFKSKQIDEIKNNLIKTLDPGYEKF